MKISSLNGKAAPMNGFSRIYPTDNFVTPGAANGFSRVVNGMTLNGISEADLLAALPQHVQREFIASVQMGDPVAMNGLKDWIARRREIKDAKVDAKKEVIAQKAEAKIQRIQSGTDLGSTLRNVAGNVINTAGGIANNALQKLGDKYLGSATNAEKIAIAETMEETPDGQTKGLFNNKSNLQKWWEDLSPWAKGGIIAGGVVLVDAVTGGNIILQRIGVMESKKKKK